MSELTDGGSRVRVRSNTAFPSLFTSTHFTALGIVAFHSNKLKEKHECKTIQKLTLCTSNSSYFDKMILNILPQFKVEPLKDKA
jgi:hypothetical protein